MATTYNAIETVTLGSAQATITFSSIPSTYTDLVIVGNYASSNSLSFLYLQFNGDTGSTYSLNELWGNASSPQSWKASNTTTPWVSGQVGCTTTVGDTISIINVQNYANTTHYKTYLARTDNTTASYKGTSALSGLWRSTSAINSISLKNLTGGTGYNFAAGTTFTLYGIKAA